MDNQDLAPAQVWAANSLSNSIYGVYIQDEWTILDHLRLNAGGRYDHYDQLGGTFNPRLGLIFEPWQNTTWKLLYGTAFRAPNAFESGYTCCAGGWVGNLGLKPEEIESYEIVWEQRLSPNFDLRLSPFYNRLSNLITLVTGPKHFENGGNAEAHGLETQFQAHFDSIEGRLSHTYQQSRSGGSDPAPNSPTHMVKFNLSAPLWTDKLFAGLEVQYVSQRTTVAASHARAYTRTNLTLSSRKWLPGVELSGGVYNLFDERYADPASPPLLPDVIPQDGRNFRIRMSYEF
jgi:iron complex outermembrane receptor protein